MSNEAEVSFSLTGDNVDPRVLTQGIPLPPTSLDQEQFHGRSQTRWAYAVAPAEGGVVDVYELTANLIAALQPHQETIALMQRTHKLDAMLQVVLQVSTEEDAAPLALGFDSDVIAFLAAVGGSVDIDTYLK